MELDLLSKQGLDKIKGLKRQLERKEKVRLPDDATCIARNVIDAGP